jgi:hypothetical protein
VVSDIQVSHEVLPFISPLDSFCVIYLESTKNPTKKFHYPRTFLTFAISFQIRFIEFVSVVESCCWFSVFVIVVQSPVAVCLFRRYPIHLYSNNKSIHPITRLCLASRLARTLTVQALDRLQAAWCSSPCTATFLIHLAYPFPAYTRDTLP